jgi:hypothetical protein
MRSEKGVLSDLTDDMDDFAIIQAQARTQRTKKRQKHGHTVRSTNPAKAEQT